MAIEAAIGVLVLLLSTQQTFSSTITCSDKTLHYKFTVHAEVFGTMEEKIDVDTKVDVDCIGLTTMMDAGKETAYDLIVHITSANWTLLNPTSSNMDNLCVTKNNQKCDGTQRAKDESARKVTMFNEKILSKPFIVVQSDKGRVLALYFNEKSANNQIINFKKDIAAALQTHLVKTGHRDESDTLGFHSAYVELLPLGDGRDKVRKHYSIINDGDRKSLQAIKQYVTDETIVSQGEIIMSYGTMSAEPVSVKNDDDEESDDSVKDHDDVDISQFSRANSSYTFTLISRSQRNRILNFDKSRYVKASLKKETNFDSHKMLIDQLKSRYKKLQVSPQKAIELIDTDSSHLSVIEDIIYLESKLGLSVLKKEFKRNQYFVDSFVKASDQIFQHCRNEVEKCLKLVNIAVYGTGRLVESRLLYLLRARANLNEDDWLSVINYVSLLPAPSDSFVIKMIRFLSELPPDSDKYSTLLLSVSAMGQESSISGRVKNFIYAIIQDRLNGVTKLGRCVQSEQTTDALEAAGNLGDFRHFPQILRIVTVCRHNVVVMTTVLSSIRRILDNPAVQSLLVDILGSFPCDFNANVLEMLISKMDEDMKTWPSYDVIEYDETLTSLVMNENTSMSCLQEPVLKYFKLKRGTRVKEILKRLTAYYSNLEDQNRRKRQTHSSCKYWSTHRGRYNDIQTSSQFFRDLRNFPKRKHCLAHFSLGSSPATVDLYKGYFIGYKSDCRNKIFGKGVAKVKLFEKTFDIATFTASFETVSCNGFKGSLYLKFDDKTYIDKKYSGHPHVIVRDFKKSVRIFSVFIMAAWLNFDAILKGGISVSLSYGVSQRQPYLNVEPRVFASAGGDIYLSIVEVLKAGAELTFDIDYYVGVEARFKNRFRKMCLRVYHGTSGLTFKVSAYWQHRTITTKRFLHWEIPWPVWSDIKYIDWLTKSWSLTPARERNLNDKCYYIRG